MPSDESEWNNKDLKFLVDFDYIFFTENYTESPFLKFQEFLHSKKEKGACRTNKPRKTQNDRVVLF